MANSPYVHIPYHWIYIHALAFTALANFQSKIFEKMYYCLKLGQTFSEYHLESIIQQLFLSIYIIVGIKK